MRGNGPIMPEIVRRLHDAAPEVVLPDSVHDRPPGERVLGTGDPLRKRRAADALRIPSLARKRRRQTRHAGQSSRLRDLARLLDLSALETVDRPRIVRYL